jgi:hypothetical protein
LNKSRVTKIHDAEQQTEIIYSETCLERNLEMTGICIWLKTFIILRILISSTSMKRYLPEKEKTLSLAVSLQSGFYGIYGFPFMEL